MNAKYKNFIILFIFIFIGGILSIYLGFDINFDMRNYHLYNPYAFLTGRIGYDIMPASIMSYYNPLLDCFYYFMIRYFNNYPAFTAFIFGISYGLLCFITFKISEIVFKNHKHNILISLLCTVIGCSAVGTVFTIGRTSHDIFLGF